MTHIEIKFVPKETLDEKTGTIYIDHRKLVRKEIRVFSKEEKSNELKEAFKNFSKKYRNDYILNFKPTTIKRVHLYHSPFGNEPICALG